MDAGKPQRKVLVDEEAFNMGLLQKATVLKRGKKEDNGTKKNES